MQILSLNLLKKKLSRYPHLNELESFIEKIEKIDLKIVLLYGSLAKGTYTQHSDIDVLCVYDKTFKNHKERFLTAYKYSNGLVQTKTLTYDEFKEGLKESNSFLHGIMKEGIILYSKIPKRDLIEWINIGKEKLNMKYFSPY